MWKQTDNSHICCPLCLPATVAASTGVKHTLQPTLRGGLCRKFVTNINILFFPLSVVHWRMCPRTLCLSWYLPVWARLGRPGLLQWWGHFTLSVILCHTLSYKSTLKPSAGTREQLHPTVILTHREAHLSVPAAGGEVTQQTSAKTRHPRTVESFCYCQIVTQHVNAVIFGSHTFAFDGLKESIIVISII